MKKIISILYFFFILACTTSHETLKQELFKAIKTEHSPIFVKIGQKLKLEFQKRKSKIQSCHMKAFHGDAKNPIGDGTATNHVLLFCPNYPNLGIRILSHSPNQNHILGFWTF